MAFQLDHLQLDLEHAKYFDGVHFFPILSSQPNTTTRYRFLWEGMEEKNVEVEELKSSSVPHVTLTNKADEVYIAYRGNIIRGGGQNRQIVHSFVVPEKQAVKIPVQCIQQGRWNPHQSKQFTQKAGEVTSSSMRFKSKSQYETWNNITERTRTTHTLCNSSDYTVSKDYYTGSLEESVTAESEITSHSQEEQTHRKERREKAITMLKEMENPLPNQVGMYVVLVDADEFVNGNVKPMECLELFGNPELYQKVHKEVINSFVTDVVMCIQGQTVELPQTTPEKFQEFLQKIKQGKWQSGASIGKETREELPKTDNSFGESISVDGEMLHLMCSIF